MTFGLVLYKIYKLLSSQDNIFLLQCSRNRHVVMPNGFISPAGQFKTFPLPPLYRTLYTVNYTHTYIYLIIFTDFSSFQSSPTSILYSVHCTVYTVNYTHTYIYLIIFTVNKVILNILLCTCTMYMYCIVFLKVLITVLDIF